MSLLRINRRFQDGGGNKGEGIYVYLLYNTYLRIYYLTKSTDKEYDRYKPWSSLRSSLLIKDFDGS